MADSARITDPLRRLPSRHTSRLTAGRIIEYVLLVIYTVVCVYPVLWIFFASLRTQSEIFGAPFGLPTSFLWQNYANAWQVGKLGIAFGNSLLAALSTVLIVLLFSSMAAYALVRVRFKGSMVLFFVGISGIFVPQQASLLPVFLLLKEFGMLNKHYTLTVVYVALNLSVSFFIMSSFLRSIPRELEEAAIIDGAGTNQIFLRVILPLAVPALSTAGVIIFLQCWNEFMFATLYTGNNLLKTIPVALGSFENEYGIFYNYISAGIILAMIPILVFYIVFQKQVVQGLTLGALKG